MADFTITVETLCREYSGTSDYKKAISGAIPHIFNFDFPIFDEEYRSVLCTKILKHYYQREICFDNELQWKMHLDARMNEIMPYYNKLYKAAEIKFNPLSDYSEERKYSRNVGADEKTKSNASSSQKGTNTEKTSGETIQKNSTTPQNGLRDLMEDRYLTAAAVANSTGSSDRNDTSETTDSGQSTRNATSIEEYIENIERRTKSGSALLQEYKNALFNVDMLVINNLADLFMSVLYV